ncbi:hypothetical protein OG792_07745 [Micromonospora sp. NBC_01699]|uniref:hypothetical protein n=1 Tax=Micromonospora sp. NBC_01699 TaxID=2975984 RepID=UPI002E328F15|nr:hypothetical protein [Micromonospora sp. NBC_01699]
MSPPGSHPHWSGPNARPSRMSGRYATGQLLALIVVVLVGLPLLPLLLVIIAWIRLRDRTQARAERRAAGSPAAPVHHLLPH